MGKENIEHCPFYDAARGNCDPTVTARTVLSRVDHELQPKLIAALSPLAHDPDFRFSQGVVSCATPARDIQNKPHLLCAKRNAGRGDPAAIARAQSGTEGYQIAVAMTDPDLIQWRKPSQIYVFEYPKEK